jgi:hypothetical protein
MNRTDRLYQWLAYRLPKGLVYWAAIRMFAHATTGKYGDTIVTELDVMEALKRWDEAK